MSPVPTPTTIAPTPHQSAVSIRSGTVEFAGGHRAVASVDVDVRRAERLAIVGQSGCGKTTLLRVIAGLQGLTSGDCHRSTDSTSFVFQQPALLPWRRVLDNVTLPLELHARRRLAHRDSGASPSPRQLALAALAEVELSNAIDRFPHQLSGGMKMRVSIARALVTRPDLLLLDEPFAALDDLLRTQLGSLVTQLWRVHQFTMVLVTHNIAEAIALSDRICIMHAGRIEAVFDNPIASVTSDVASDSESDVRRTAAFGEFYGVITDRLRAAAGP
ncbi:ABC transporter ATP-binding protein [Allorhodopirellula heiligendammensis]|uniref:Aliphatic sulfonates import ATP-binding protein SsuB n=1 Tax=Allorhodopirellula heiligendammensis TaxID=2714739 RepID=A0A5C6BX79_9BACT|nr:ATP-binding cassette domain-containing protein [Allorhodopirellula heiligendammensis]TWU15886.1 Aliphatic sulfonates import ATP-binding protein SsuB [Allorhodopirellula heiligendammensis]